MADVIQGVFIDPPIAIARLGASSVPQDAYSWIQSPDPRADGETAVGPEWSLRVLPDGTVDPYMPKVLTFRDGQLIRPVCPFFEVWALVGEPGSDASAWREVPLTPTLLQSHGTDPSALRLRITAHNLKAARRTGDPMLGFGTHPPVEIRSDQHEPVSLEGTSPPDAQTPMIPRGRSIKLGSVQVMRSRVQPPAGSADWTEQVDVEVIRFRFTPAGGRFYGPPQALQTTPVAAVAPGDGFLSDTAGWYAAPVSLIVAPADTYDGAEVGLPPPQEGPGPSLGVVDDACDARIEVVLDLPGGGAPLSAHANVFVGPPDYAPDRRPFLSLADEINDRSRWAPRSAAMTPQECDAWVEDLFERIYETVAQLNVDIYRATRALTLSGNRLRDQPLAGDAMLAPKRAMGGSDKLRNDAYTIQDVTAANPLPLSEHARMRHRALSDLQTLRAFVEQNQGRLADLVRRAFEVEDGESRNLTTMRMPPFMRQSNAYPLTLAAWQYELLMEWVEEVETGTAGAVPMAGAVPPPPAPNFAAAADRRQQQILAALDRGAGFPS